MQLLHLVSIGEHIREAGRLLRTGGGKEWKVVRSMEALREIGGDLAPADARLIGANNIRVNESALTGESGFRATKSPRRVVPDPGLRKAVVRVQPAEPGPPGWLLILGMSLIPFLWGQGLRAMQAMKNRDHERTGCP